MIIGEPNMHERQKLKKLCHKHLYHNLFQLLSSHLYERSMVHGSYFPVFGILFFILQGLHPKQPPLSVTQFH